MFYALIFLAFGLWAAVILRGQPLRLYVPIYFLGGVACHFAESLYAILLDLYEYRAFALPDPFADARLVETTIGFGSHALIAVLFAYYCRRSPLLAILGGAAGLALLEEVLHRQGMMIYHGWSPWYTFGMYVLFFLALWPVAIERIRLPAWFSVYLGALWALFVSETLLQGALELWRYDLAITGQPRDDSVLFATILLVVLVAPIITVGVLRLRQQKPMALVLVPLLLLLLEGLLVVTGLKVYQGWSVWLAALRFVATTWVTLLYAAWLLPRLEVQRQNP